ncbi:MAG: molybdopterin-dependent oxidoreductase [Bacteroidota bacterium]|nr:molybdopterin-dependent oxidoreductase [Bacteroidota bacterium]
MSNSEEQKVIKKRNWLITKWLSFAALFIILGGISIIVYSIDNSFTDSGAKVPLRKVLNFNELINNKLFSVNKLAPEYQKSEAVKIAKVNGGYGVEDPDDTTDYVLILIRRDTQGKSDTVYLDMEDIKALPYKEVTFNFKCIEGWSQITNWGGVSLGTFLAHYNAGSRLGESFSKDQQTNLFKYCGLTTVDEQYYVGIDMPSCLQEQTLLCYNLNGKKLPFDQGYPLRLIVPTKYGIKSIKRIGTIFFSDSKPKDFWYNKGYDYDAAL